MHFFRETWTCNVWTMMTISKLSQHNQFPTRLANQFPSGNWSIISVFDCRRLCTVLSMLRKDGTTVLRLIFETVQVRNPSWNPVCGLSEMKTVSFRLCAWFTSMISCQRVVTLHLANMSLKALTICMSGGSGSHECSNSVAHKSLKPTISTLEHGVDSRSASQNT